MINRTITSFLFVVAFLILTVLYYWMIILVDKPMVYGVAYGITRAIVIFSGFGYFWMLTQRVKTLHQAKRKINQFPSAQNKSENAVFEVKPDSIYYTEQFKSYKYNLVKNSINIIYDDFTFEGQIHFKNDTLIITADEYEPQMFRKFIK